jgi:hypothetical protein
MRKLCAMLLISAGMLAAGEKGLMHCFAYTPIPAATEADWQAFYKATDALTGKIPGIQHVWYGKLRNPLAIFNPDADARKKLGAGEAKATGEVTRVRREHGVCMFMKDADTLANYAKHPYHKDWMAAYEKVRVAGTTTFDILSQ